ncbi:MAG: RluA family pseudouridine synthase [Deltaproteobacteria bacterium]|nr:RluA family pseudouridine synthase [Deltaproteobacteria bacterium]
MNPEIPILYEDPDLLIVNKPAGLPTQGVGETTTSLIALQYPEILLLPDQGAVHRLDNDTSGLVVIARNQKCWEAMRELFSRNQVQKEYFALVWGKVLAKGEIDLPIGSDPKSSKRVKVYRNKKEAVRNRAQSAVTFYEPVQATRTGGEGRAPGRAERVSTAGRNLRQDPSTWLRIRIKTGRRHQIRAHLAAIGHPVVGDKIYKNQPVTHVPGTEKSRHCLHATSLRFRHPQTGREFFVEAPLPPDMREMIPK